MNKNHEDIFLKINQGEQEQLKDLCDRYGIEYDKNIPLKNGRKVRGYHGVCRHPGANPFSKN